MFKCVFTRYAYLTKYVLSDFTVVCRSRFSVSKNNSLLNIVPPTIFDLSVLNFSTGNCYKQKGKHVLEVIPIKTVTVDNVAQTIKKRAQRRKRGVDGTSMFIKPGVSLWNVYNRNMLMSF